ncbi:MAG: alkaline phosphatase D family protein [Solirubrobacterales bacterium]
MSELTRRDVVRHAAVGSAALAIGGAVPGWARLRPPLLAEGRFETGVLAGFPGQRSAILMSRLARVEQNGRVRFEVAADPGFGKIVKAGETRIRPNSDFTARKTIRGLEPGERYWYRFETKRRSSPVGSFRTRRPPDSAEPVRIGFFSCQGWQPGYYTAHAGLAEEDLDLVVSLGDYIYELTDDDGPREDTIGPAGDGEAQTLAEYREKYHLYQSDPDLQATHAAHGFACVWDDHELESGWQGPHEGETQGRERRVPYEKRVRNGRRAFFEHLPVPRIAGNSARIYRSIPLGRSAELFMLDLHSYASNYVCGFAIPPKPCPQASDPALTMLGGTQKEWLKGGLERSGARWKVLGNSLMMMSLDLYPGQSFNYSQWDGYEVERRELMQFLLDRQIDGVTVVSGDIHTFFAGSVTTTGRSNGTAAATEFVGGSISSEGIAQGVSEALGVPEDSSSTEFVTQRLREVNPHFAHVDTVNRGYAVLEATTEELRVDFRGPVSVLEPKSEIRTWASFRVDPERPVVEWV